MSATQAQAQAQAQVDETKTASLSQRLEKEGMEKVKTLRETYGIIPPGDQLCAIIQSGFDEFKKETGREMTYCEMREMYG